MNSKSYFSLLFFFTILCCLTPTTVKSQYTKDLSKNTVIIISEPKIAYLNITGITELPTGKSDDIHAYAEYTDNNGYYFKKKVILNAQGATSLQYPKKNLSVKFCEDEWIGDNTTSIRIGNRVKQDSFHFKAGWIDTFRGGLSVAVAYNLYGNMVSDEPRIQERANLDDYSSYALCHSDGFPCIISLNGDFIGIYAWLWKKHRKNMDMDKDNPKHVWFQLENYASGIETGKINWDGIEIENPKDPTDESKGYIENLALYNNELKSLSKKSTKDEMRVQIANRFDVTSAIDFYIHGIITSNIDGFAKNANYFTYDGVKWFVMPYDLDETFGNSWIATFQYPAQQSFATFDYTMSATMYMPPFNWIINYYWDDICKRYATLRNNGVFTTDSITNILKDWNNRVGNDNYSKEYTKWYNCPSNNTTIINDKWEYIEDWSKYSKLKEYSDSSEYHAGDYCTLDYRVWKAKQNVSKESPLIQTGYTDTEERFKEWIEKRIELEDAFFEYSNTHINNITVEKQTPKARKIIVNGQLYIKTPHGLYTATGIKYI